VFILYSLVNLGRQYSGIIEGLTVVNLVGGFYVSITFKG